MSRLRIQLPSQFNFATQIPIRITDLNYGGHVGNDTILTLAHEARMQFLKSLGYTELELEGRSLIMSDAAIEFRAELFYGDVITVQVAAGDFSRAGFQLYYRLTKADNVLVAVVKTGMICYDYTAKKVTALPEEAVAKLSGNNMK
jgi:acyl-CoA thioester hydrolase